MRRITALCLATVVAVSVAACGGDDDRSAGQNNDSNGGDEQVLVVPVQSAPQSLNPNWQDDVGSYYVSGNIFSTLVILDWGVAEGTTAYGDLAESWEASEDGTTYTFTLRDGVTWHDGEAFSSADVLYTYQTVMDNDYPGAEVFAGATLSAPDESTFVVSFPEPNVSFIPLLAQVSNWYLKVLPQHIYDGEDWATSAANENPVGTGPFVFDSSGAQQATLTANPDHYLGEPEVDRLVLRVVPDASVANEAFNAGEYPYLPSQYVTSYEDIRRRLDTESGTRVIETPSTYGRDVIFNMTVEPFDDVDVRRAIAYAIDRAQISELAFRNLWEPAYTAGSPYVPTYLNEDATFPEYDPGEAERLLDEAGYPRGDNGTRFTMRFTNATQEDSRLIAEVLVEQLKAVGIDVQWETYDQATWSERVKAGGDWVTSTYFTRYGPDPEAYCEHFQTDANRNFGGYSNRQVDQACDDARQTTDETIRTAAYDLIQEQVVTDLPYINLFGQLRFSLADDAWQCLPVDECGFDQSLGWFGFRSVIPPGE
ncbi:hypothetical protein G1H11_14425 [Phytoactinopolyspora alkaliphila]|uniref:Solute-binding protein family 5 domain-containing protein n=1 Tax=Phytoactinopolyspora alkaliphila TaxID=1783498 RepID=A0A6N9YNF4_9ACTN|nr:ABC transporter substrate-binding protein [Phytoactinopolyspora alkaliphila]NED96502.1 hypothetical protein [Phytoactinopolyspora alkaliphila]